MTANTLQKLFSECRDSSCIVASPCRSLNQMYREVNEMHESDIPPRSCASRRDRARSRVSRLTCLPWWDLPRDIARVPVDKSTTSRL
jgi:hypothetical protein